MNNHRKPKYTTPHENEERIRNLPRERYRTPSSKFAGRNITEEIPVLTEKTMACLVKQLSHTEYLQRVDAAERMGELIEKGADADKFLPALEMASEDYSPFVRDAVRKALAKTEKAKNRVEEIANTDPFIRYNGRLFTLPEAFLRGGDMRTLARQKLAVIAFLADRIRDDSAKIAIIGQMQEIINDNSIASELRVPDKADLRRIIHKFSNDSHPGVKTLARTVHKNLDSA